MPFRLVCQEFFFDTLPAPLPVRSKANSIRLQQSQVKEVLEKAQHSQKEGRAFLQKTLHQQRTRDAEERKKEREEMERRTQAVLSLKRNTENSEVYFCKHTINSFHTHYTGNHQSSTYAERGTHDKGEGT